MKVNIRRKYIVSKKEQAIIFKFLNGELSTRETAEKLNMSHQNVINLTCSLCRQWFQEGKLTLKR